MVDSTVVIAAGDCRTLKFSKGSGGGLEGGDGKFIDGRR